MTYLSTLVEKWHRSRCWLLLQNYNMCKKHKKNPPWEHWQYHRLAFNQSSCEAWVALKMWKMIENVTAVVFIARYLICAIKFTQGLKLPSSHAVRKWIFICAPYMTKLPLNPSFSIYVHCRKFVLSSSLILRLHKFDLCNLYESMLSSH